MVVPTASPMVLTTHGIRWQRPTADLGVCGESVLVIVVPVRYPGTTTLISSVRHLVSCKLAINMDVQRNTPKKVPRRDNVMSNPAKSLNASVSWVELLEMFGVERQNFAPPASMPLLAGCGWDGAFSGCISCGSS